MNIGGLAGLLSGLDEGRENALRRQVYQAQLADIQSKTQGQEALANAYASIPTPPNPGQGSQPQQRPQQQMPMPQQARPPMMQQQGPQPGQLPPMPSQQQQPPQGTQGPLGSGRFLPQPQQAIPPYVPPQAPPTQQPQQAALPPPPQDPVSQMVDSRLPSLTEMAQTLKKQGVTGSALYQALQMHQGFLSTEGKQQLQMLTAELRERDSENRRLQADAAIQRAQTGAAGEQRREATAEGTNASGKATIELKEAQAKAALARANKAATAGAGAAPEDLDAVARSVADYNLDIRSLSTKGGLREKVLDRALKINPDFDQKRFNADNAFNTSSARTAGTSAANSAIAATAAQGGADILEKASAAVPRSAFRSLNKAWNAGRGEFNVPEYGAFSAALNTFVNEYARAVNPKGTATISDKDHAREILSASDSPETFKAKMNILRQEMQRSRQAPKDVAADQGLDVPKPKPSASDRAFAKTSPEAARQFKEHFGVDP